MEYFIIEEGYMWGEILRILEEKAKAGVDVRVMYDGMCEITLLPSNYCELLEQHGIKAKTFAPIRPIVSSHYNYRDHRKILVIDGKVAFNGGVNLADEYINRVERFGHWKDTAVMLKGDAVRSFTLMFLQMWNITEEPAEFKPWIAETGYVPQNPSGFVIPFGDCPLDEDKVGRAVYMDILNRATDYVHIMTPYLILDDELKTALIYAAQRGVDVRLILPGIPDKKLAFALAKSHYKRLVDAGVKIYEYTPGFRPRQGLRQRRLQGGGGHDQPGLPEPVPPFRVRDLPVQGGLHPRHRAGFPGHDGQVPPGHTREHRERDALLQDHGQPDEVHCAADVRCQRRVVGHRLSMGAQICPMQVCCTWAVDIL